VLRDQRDKDRNPNAVEDLGKADFEGNIGLLVADDVLILEVTDAYHNHLYHKIDNGDHNGNANRDPRVHLALINHGDTHTDSQRDPQQYNSDSQGE
jgi:hypothetical protein